MAESSIEGPWIFTKGDKSVLYCDQMTLGRPNGSGISFKTIKSEKAQKQGLPKGCEYYTEYIGNFVDGFFEGAGKEYE